MNKAMDKKTYISTYMFSCRKPTKTNHPSRTFQTFLHLAFKLSLNQFPLEKIAKPLDLLWLWQETLEKRIPDEPWAETPQVKRSLSFQAIQNGEKEEVKGPDIHDDLKGKIPRSLLVTKLGQGRSSEDES